MTTSAAVRRPKMFLAGAALVAALGAFSLPAVQGLAEDFLSVFRVKSFQAVTPPDRSDLPAGLNPKEFVKVISSTEGQKQTYTSVAEAKAAGYAVRVPSILPLSAAISPKVEAKGASEARISVDRQKAEAALAAAGLAGVTLDPKLEGAEFTIQMPAGVVLSYGDNIMVAQAKSPEVLGPPGMDYEALRTQALGVLTSFAPETAAQLAAIPDWRTTMPLPVRAGSPRQTVTVDGVQGLLVGVGSGTPAQSTVVWEKGGMVYGVWGAASSADLLAAANSLH